MSEYNATILFKKSPTESAFSYKYIDYVSQSPLFKFLFRVLNDSPKGNNTWIEAKELTENHVDTFKLRILIYPPNQFIKMDLTSSDVLLGQKFFKSKNNIPILHVVLTDIMSDNKKLHPSVPRYYQIIDSSIWNHYVPMVKFDGSDDGFHALLTKAVNEIYENYTNGLYDIEVADEFADVNARVLQQSYLSRNHGIGVAPFIFHSESTIKKLSDTEFKEFKDGFKEKKKGTDKEQDSNWLWRFLLVDDKAIEKDEDNTLKKSCKLSIIIRLIEKALFPGNSNWIKYRLLEQQGKTLDYVEGSKNIDKNTKIVIDCVQHYDDAVTALKERKYDLILLDYLLDLKDGLHKYGYELLEEINQSVKIKEQYERFSFRVDYSSCKEKAYALKDLISEKNHVSNYNELKNYIRIIVDENSINDESIEELLGNIQTEIEKKQFQIGPCGKQFFIFISAYSTAVNERLLAQGLNRSEDYWYINTGACPTNTPQLFTYNLLHSMKKRLNDCGFLKLTKNKVLELVEFIFTPQNVVTDKNNSVRRRAGRHYHEVLSLQYHYRRMLDDVEIPHDCNNSIETLFDIKGSVLISNYSLQNRHIGGLLEHLTNLVHIAAFGTIRQWDEMWEEYLYFKANFGAIIPQDDEDTTTAFKRICGYIENFILRLKSQQR